MLDDPVEAGDHLASTGSPWPENPNCIYMGGFGLGPMNPVSSWNEDLGLWVRAVALRDRDGDDLVLVVLDGEGYFWDYGAKCDDCGIKQLTDQLAADERARPRGRGHRRRRDPRALGARLHRRLGLRAGLVHEAGRGHDQGDGPRRGRLDAPGGARVRRARRRARSTASGATPTARPRSSSSRGCARTCRADGGKKKQPRRRRDDRDDRRLRRPPDHVRHERRRGASRLARPVRGEPRGALRRRRPPLHDRPREHVGRRARARGRPEPVDRRGRPGRADRAASAPATRSRSRTSARRARPGPSRSRTRRSTALGVPGFFDRQFAQSPATVRTGEDPDKFQCSPPRPCRRRSPRPPPGSATRSRSPPRPARSSRTSRTP